MPGTFRRSSNSPRGFTLVELLVSIVIIGIIGSMVAIAVSGAKRQAQDTRGQGMVDNMNLLILQIYEEEAQRRINLPSGATTMQARALSFLMWKRDWLRCSLPDRRDDLAAPVFVPFPTATAAIDPAGLDGDPFGMVNDNKLTVPAMSLGINATGIRSQEVLRYRSYIVRSISTAKNISVPSFGHLVDNNLINGEWTSQYQSAECLYMILATHVVNGIPAKEALRQRDIGDVDQDGMPEVLDPWGVPLGFMRWPVGLSITPDWNDPVESPESTTIRSQWAELAAMKDALGKDNIDILYQDPRYTDNTTVAAANSPQAEDPFPLNPIVVSAGADGDFDLYGLDAVEVPLPPGPPPVPPPVPLPPPTPLPPNTYYVPPRISYTSGGLPNTSPSFVNPPFFPPAMRFIDPYMDGVVISQKLGARVDFNGNGIDDSADNILPAFVLQ